MFARLRTLRRVSRNSDCGKSTPGFALRVNPGEGLQKAEVGIDTVQLVAAEFKRLQAGKAAELRRDVASELVLGEIQLDDAAVRVGRHSVPLADWRVTEPVVAIGPCWSIGALIEGDQDAPVTRSLGDIGSSNS